MLVAPAAVAPVLFSAVLSLSGPLAAGRWVLVPLLGLRLALGVVVLVLVRGRRQAPHLLAVGFLVLVLLTGLWNHEYDAWLVLVSGAALLLTGLAAALDRFWTP